MQKRIWIAGTAAAVAVTGLMAIGASFRADLNQAQRRVSTGSSVAPTPCGAIEYADIGQGRPLLAIHGTGGGFDQGLLMTKQTGLDVEGYRIIAPSRYGYLRTPLPAGSTDPAAEADAHACLLDSLGIREPAIVMGASAGALSATQFAIKYPERVASLVLTVPANWAPPSSESAPNGTVGGSNFIMSTVLRSDFVMWSFLKLAKGQMAAFIGVSEDLQKQLTAEDEATIDETLETILPVSRRYKGILKDAANHEHRERYDLERIKAPTLIVDAMDMDTFPGAKYSADHIRNAQLIAYPTGGHLLVGHGAETREAISNFLKEQ